MIKRVPSRNPRSKGVKVKHVLQICLLLGVCFWLIYQVKHSHDKKEFDEKEAKDISDDGLLKLGRKDLPTVPELTKNDKHNEDEEEEMGTGDEALKEEENKLQQELEEAEMKHREEEEEGKLDGESKHDANEQEEEGTKHEEEEREENKNEEEEEEQEEGNKREATEDEEGRGGGDDEIDEHDQDKIEGEADHDEDATDEEKERKEEGEEEETGTTDVEDKIQLDPESSLEDQDQDGGDRNAHEAREVHYKADDASSAVTHDSPILITEPENATVERRNNTIEGVSGDHDNQTLLLEQGSTDASVSSLNTTAVNDEKLLAKLGDKLNNDSTSASLSNDQSIPNNTSSGLSTEAGIDKKGNSTEVSDLSQHDETKVVLESGGHDAKVNGSTTENVPNLQTTGLEQVNDKNSSDKGQSDPSSNFPSKTEGADTSGRDSLNSTTHLESHVSDTNIKPEIKAEGEVSLGLSLTTKEVTDATHNDNPESTNESGGTDKIPDYSTTDGKGENEEINNPPDTSNSSIVQDERENHLDLSTLLENSSDGVNDRNTAAE